MTNAQCNVCILIVAAGAVALMLYEHKRTRPVEPVEVQPDNSELVMGSNGPADHDGPAYSAAKGNRVSGNPPPLSFLIPASAGNKVTLQ